jgi:murein DD-endopeptidase MepM/ murein hydrolase activator NlpD
MPPKTDNHKIYDDDIKNAELGNKQVIDKDVLTDKEAQLADRQSQASSGFTQYIDNAKVFLRKNPKKSAGIGFGLFGVLSAVYLSIISLGPLQFINMAEMLQNFNFSDQEISTSHRIRNLYNYSQLARGADGKLENTRLGTIESSLAKKIDRKLAKSGMTMEYSRPGGKFQGVNIDLDNMSDEMKNELKGAKTDDERNKAIAKMFDVDIGSVERNGNVIHIRAEGMKNSRRLISKVLNISPDFDIRTTALAKRILIIRSNLSFNPNTRLKENIKTSLAERYKKFQENRKERLSSKLNDLNLPDKPGSKIFNKVINKIITSVGQITTESASLVAVPIAVVQLGCTVRDSGESLAKLQTLNKVIPMINAANEVISTSSKIKDGQDVDMAFLENLQQNFNQSTSKGDSSWYNASTVQYINGLDNTSSSSSSSQTTERTFDKYPELNPDNKSNIQKVNNILESADALMNNAQQLTPVGPIINAYNAVSPEKIKATDLSCGVVNLPGDILTKITDFIGPHIPGYNKLKEITDKWGQQIISWIAGSAIDLTEDKYAGAPYMEAVSLGARFMANESAMSMGGTPLSDQQELALNQQVNSIEKQQDNRSFVARIFDLTDYKSPASKIAVNINKTSSTNRIIDIPKFTFNNIASNLTPKTHAQVQPSDIFYGVPKVGYELSKFDSEAYEDPYKNAEIVYNALTQYPDKKAHFEECTGVKITDDFDFVTKSFEDSDNPVALYLDSNYDSKCKDMKTDEILYRTSILAFDTTTIKSFSCIEFDDQESCNSIMPGSNNDDSGGSSSEEGAFIQGDYAWPVGIFKKDLGSPNMPCATSPPYCHHDDSPAFDLSTKNTPDAENKPVYAITDGKMWLTKNFKGIENCYTFNILGDDGYDYFYGHVKNAILTNENATKRVKKGDKIAEIGTLACGDNTINHLHIDQSKEYNHAVSSRTENLIKIMNDLYANLPDTAPPVSELTGDWQWPLKTDIKINSCFNQPLSKGPHPGLDFFANMNTPVYAVASGKVVGQLGGSYGVIEIKHDEKLYSVYEHLSSIDVKKGQSIQAGEKIGMSGQTGAPGAPHLHFGLTEDVNVFAYAQMGQGKIINPLKYLNNNKDYQQCSANPSKR